MTLPSRKNRRITAWKLQRPTNATSFATVCFLAVSVCSFALPASAQYQEPPKFQKPTSYRYLLGVRNNNQRGYGSATNRGRQPANRGTAISALAASSGKSRPANQVSNDRFPDARSLSRVQYQHDETSSQPIGSGVKRTSRQYAGLQQYGVHEKRSGRSNLLQTTAYQSGQQGFQNARTGQNRPSTNSQVDPIDDPFGDLSSRQFKSQRIASQFKPKRSNGFVSPVTRQAPQTRRSIQTANRVVARQEDRQESILRRPDNAPVQQLPYSRNVPAQPVGSHGLSSPTQDQPPTQLPFNQGQPNQQPDTQQPMNQDPVNQQPMTDTTPLRQANPMQNDPMQSSPMRTDPMRNQDTLRQQVFDLDCTEINGVMLQKSIRDIALNLKPRVDEGKVLPQSCTFEGEPAYARCWAPQTFVWTASAACSKPLYYQHIQLERYGHSRGPIIQPILSAAHFFGNVAIWPYKAGIHPPNECMYALGYYRPGDCAPWLREPWPWSAKGAASQALSAVGYTGVFR